MPRKREFSIDMSSIKKGRHESIAKRMANAVTQYLEQLYPANQGYKYGHKLSKIRKTQVKVWRGLRWGYSVVLEAPTDYPNLSIELDTFSRFFQVLIWGAPVLAIIVAGWFGFAKIIPEFGNTVPFAITLWAVLRICIWAMRSLVWVLVDKAARLEEMERMFHEIQDLLHRDLSSNPDDFRKTDEERETLQSLASRAAPSDSKSSLGVCQKCGFDNPEESMSCRVCGTQLVADGDVDLWFDKGVTLLNSDQIDEALACFNRVLEINSQHVGAWANKGTALAKSGLIEESVPCFERAVEIKPGSAVWFSLGHSLRELGRWEDAARSYDRFLKINPDSADTWA